MHELAPLRLASSRLLDWESARIPGKPHDDLIAVHLRCLAERSSECAVALKLPTAGRIARLGSVEAIWMGHGEWLLLTAGKHHKELAALQDAAAANGAVGARTEDGLIIVELGVTRGLLASLTGLPPEALAAGRSARTRAADIAVTIASGPAQRFRLIFDRAFGPHMRAWFDRAI